MPLTKPLTTKIIKKEYVHISIELIESSDYNHSSNSACFKKGVSPIMASHVYIKGSLCNDKGTWAVRARIQDPITGRTRHRTKSTGLKVSGNNRRKAEAKMREIVEVWEREANTGIISDINPLFRDCVNRWLDAKSLTIKPNTLQSYRVIADKYIIPMLGHIRICNITRQHLQRYFELLKDKTSPNSMKKHRVIIHGVLEDAYIDGVVQSNVSDSLRLPKVVKFEGTALSLEQTEHMLHELERQPEPVKSIVTLAIAYGLRRSEICGLRWKDIDFSNSIMYIRNTVTQYSGQIYEAEETKTKASRRNLCLIQSTIPYLKSLEQSQIDHGICSGKVCAHSDGHTIQPEYVTRAVKRFLTSCGFENVRLHDLRHTVATLLVNRVPLKHVQSFLGHESIETTSNIYSHTLTNDKIETAKCLDDFFKSVQFCSESCSE